ncbi:MAG TPA: adenylate/guanylate cyclase domain-containing protein [Gaiellaceae bacterium]|jgi:class 3 adenylate cyclase|nr:adenylate/guanylate cyclase domain-containing protein [Gaiellaceae bacterium]
MATLPTGTVTFLFTDIEGSTRLLQELGDRYGDVVRDHRRIVREHFSAAGGSEVDTQGDAFFYSFPRSRDAVAGAVAAQRALAEHDWPGGEVRVRMGLHTGEPTVGEEGYLGLDVVRAARICSAGHGGQILLSETTRALLGNDLPEGVSVVDLGRQNLKDIQHERLFQLALDDQDRAFPPLKTEEPESDATLLAKEIQDHVREQILESLSGAGPTRKKKRKRARSEEGLKYTVIGLVELLLVVLAIAAIVLIVKAVF